MPSTNVNIRIDIETKKEAEELFDSLGIKMTTAINIFLKQAIREKGIPFMVSTRFSNTDYLRNLNTEQDNLSQNAVEEDMAAMKSE